MDNTFATPKGETKTESFVLSQNKEDVVNSIKPEDIPVSLYHQKMGKPFIAEVLGITDVSLSQNKELAGKLVPLEEFIIGQIRKNNFEETQKSYRAILKDVSKIIGINEHENAVSKIDKLHTLIAIRKLFT